jgi:outer membrane lipoprotein-sorting protein
MRATHLAAAVLAAAAAVPLLGPAPAARADVAKAAEKYKVVKFKVEMSADDKRSGLSGQTTLVAYADLTTPRYRRELRPGPVQGLLDQGWVYLTDGKKDRTLGLYTSTWNKAAEDKSQAELLEKVKGAGFGPAKQATLTRALPPLDGWPAKDITTKTFLEHLREVEGHKEATAIKDKVGGREATRYLLEQDNWTTRLWVDGKTGLPVRVEVEVTDPNPNTSRQTWALTDFEWDPVLKGFKRPDELFGVTPPEGYTLTDETKKND